MWFSLLLLTLMTVTFVKLSFLVFKLNFAGFLLLFIHNQVTHESLL